MEHEVEELKVADLRLPCEERTVSEVLWMWSPTFRKSFVDSSAVCSEDLVVTDLNANDSLAPD
jgi:hypothetical protein